MMKREVLGEPTQLILFAMLSIIAILFFGLSDLDNASDFRALIIFTITYFLSFYTLLFLSATKFGDRISGKNLRFWFFKPITPMTLLYVPFGVGGAFVASAFAGFAFTNPDLIRVVAITGAGIVFLALLLVTRSFLIPTLAHGIFNTIVLILTSNVGDTASFLSTISYPIPVIGLTLGSLNALASESLFQMVLVAPAEEFFKILVMTFVVLGFKGRFKNIGYPALIGSGIFGVVMWAIFHLIRSGVQINI